MTYAALQDLIDLCGQLELVQLTDRADPPAGAMDAGVIGAALASADSEIDAYLSVRYALPLDTTPQVIADAAADIARYRLWKDRASDEVRRRYDDAIKLLKALANGGARLEVAGLEIPAAAGGGVRLNGNRRLFTRDSLRNA